MSFFKIIIWICWITLWTHTIYAKTWIVNSTSELSSINQAIQIANPYDSIHIQAGTYYENLVNINKPLFIKGLNSPIIDAQGGDEILVITSNEVVITGLILKNVGSNFLKDRAAIRLNNVNNVTVENNKLLNTFFGIYLQNSSNCKIQSNIIIGNAKDEINSGNAIHIWKGNSIAVVNNQLSQHRDGIYLEFVNQSFIKQNISQNNMRYGLHFMFSNYDIYEENIFESNGSGVAVMFSKQIKMIKNQFLNNRGQASYGILLKEITDGLMSQNNFKGNTIGIYAEGANRMQIERNNFISNGKAMDIKGNCLNNEIRLNNFINNTFEVLTNSKSNLNLFEKNYWGQYKGYDLNHDGIGDVPHRPVNLFALVTNKVPAANMLIHSFLVNSLEMAERLFPQLIPAQLMDKYPMMIPIDYD